MSPTAPEAPGLVARKIERIARSLVPEFRLNVGTTGKELGLPKATRSRFRGPKPAWLRDIVARASICKQEVASSILAGSTDSQGFVDRPRSRPLTAISFMRSQTRQHDHVVREPACSRSLPSPSATG